MSENHSYDDNAILPGTDAADTITFTATSTTVDAGEGVNTITGTSGNNYIISGGGADTISLTSGRNTILAGEGANTITATLGNNVIESGDGADTITVTSGNNTINAGGGANTIVATSGINVINTGDGADTITTGGLADGGNTINAGDGANTITTGAGDDTITGGNGADTITTGAGNDVVYAGNGANTITTGAGNDIVYSGVDADTITTGAGDDVINIKGGTDTIAAGAGNDTLIADFSLARGAVSINTLAGTAAAGYAGNISGLGIATFAGVENFEITSGDSDDTITTGDGNDVVHAGAGSDTVNLAGGNDKAIYTMAANSGASDVYQGGTGVDTLTLELTTAEWFNPLVQNDIANYLAFQAAHTNPTTGEVDSAVFQFTAFDLSASEFEALNVIVDGVALDPTDEAVTAVADTATVNEEDTATTFTSVLGNDSVPDLAYSVALVSGPEQGTLDFNPGLDGAPNGSYSFDPNDEFEDLAFGESRNVSFVYQVQDADGDTDQATVTITVTGTNDVPTVGATVANTTNEDAAAYSVDLLDGASDVDTTDVLNVANLTVVSGDATGITLSGNALSVNPSAYTALAVGTSEIVTYSYNIVDGNGGSGAQTASVTINGVNDAPTITTATGGNEGAVTEAGNEDAGAIVAGVLSATGTLTSSDVDNGATAQWAIVVDGTNTTNLGAISIDPTSGDWTYTLDQSASDYLAEGDDATETFTATVTDQFGATATQVVSVMITGTNDAPVVSGPLMNSTSEDYAFFNIDMLAGTTDVDAGETATLGVQNVTGLVDGITLSGSTLTVDPADAAFQHLGVGDSDVIPVNYEVVDAQGATDTQVVTVTLTGTNDAPVITSDAVAASGSVIEEGNDDAGAIMPGVPSATGTLSSDDIDTGASATWSGNAVGTYGSFAIISTTGAWTYTLDNTKTDTGDLAEGQVETETFTVTVTDEFGATDTQDVTVTVAGTNDGPLALDDTLASGPADAANWTYNPDNGHYYRLVDQGSTFAQAISGSDALGGYLATVTTPSEQAFIEANGLIGQSSDAMWIGGQANFASQGSSAQWTWITGPEAGQLFSYANWNSGEPNGAFSGSNQYAQVYSPTHTFPGFWNDAPDSLLPGNGQADSYLVEWGGLPGDTGFDEDTVLTIDAATLLANDIDVDTGAILSVTAVSAQSAAGVPVSLSGTDISYDPTVVFNHLAAGESATDTFTYTVTDEFGATDKATVTLTVQGLNDGPVAIADTNTGDAVVEAGGNPSNTPFAGDNTAAGNVMLGSDADVDASDILSVASVNSLSNNVGIAVQGTYGSVLIGSNGVYTYTLNDADPDTNALARGEAATDVFSYEVSDGNGGNDTATLTIAITGTNDAPTLAAITAAATEDGTDITVDLAALGGDVDSDNTGGTLTYTVSGAPAEGAASIDGTTLTFATGTAFQDLKLNDTRDVIVQVTATDGHSATAVNTVTITVTGTNDAPTATVDTNATDPLVEQGFGVAGDSTATGNLLSNDSDPDTTDVLSVTNVDAGTGEAGSNMPVEAPKEQIVFGKFGSLAVAATGVWTYSLNNADADTEALEDGETGIEAFTYMISDGNGGTDTATLTLEIAGSGDNVAPVAVDDAITLDEDTPTTLDLVGNDTDTNNVPLVTQTLSVASINGVAAVAGAVITTSNGSITMGAGGAVNYTPNGNYTGTDSFTYVTSDGLETSGSATAQLTIDPVNNVAVIGGVATGAVTEDAVLTSSKLTASDGRFDQFGWSTSVSADGSTIVVGAYMEDNLGFAYVFNRDGTLVTRLTVDDATRGDQFGYSTSVSGDGSMIVIGVRGDDDAGSASGSAYVFNRDGTPVTKLTAPDGAAGDQFGCSTSVSADGSTIVVGARGDDDAGSGSGSAYVFNRDGTLVTKLTTTDAAAGDQFGYSTSVSADGSTIVMGGDANGGTASTYVFNRDGTEVTKLTAPDAAAGDSFGFSTSVSGDGSTIVVGARGDDDAGSASGSAYVFNRDGTEVTKLTATDGAAYDFFGWSTTVSGDGSTIVIGSLDEGQSGSAYVFDRDGTLVTKLTAFDAGGGDRFGWSPTVSADGSTIVVGASAGLTAGIRSGSAYVFQRNGDGNFVDAAGNIFGSTGIIGTQTLGVEDTVSGALTVADVDAGEAALQEVPAGTLGDKGFGSFAMGTDGAWTFTLNNAAPAVQALAQGQIVTDTITVTSFDGSATQEIEVTITGTNDAPVNTVFGADTEMEKPVALQLSVADPDSGSGEMLTTILAATVGTLSAGPVSGVTITGGTTTTMTFTGELGPLNVALAGVVFTPDSAYAGQVQVTMTTSDNGNAGAGGGLVDIDTAFFEITQSVGRPLAFAGEEITNSTAVDLTDADLDAMLDVALDRWANAGMSQEGLDMMAGAEIMISDLGGTTLGATLDGSIVIDINAAGQGWYIDETPEDDFEFVDSSGPEGVDLLTVVMHELGHIVGLEHSENDAGHSVMAAELDLGERLMVSEFDGRDASIEYVRLSTDIFDYF